MKMRLCVFLMLPALLLLAACDDKPRQEQVAVDKSTPPPVDSLALQITDYERKLATGRQEIDQAIRQLGRLSKQLQDSIEGTAVPPQIQEETINNYRNKLYEVRQVQNALRNWQTRDTTAVQELSKEERKAYLQDQLQQLDQLMQETREARREAQGAMQESDREEY